MPFLRKYNTLLVTGTTAIRIPIIKRAVVDFAVGADWTPAAGDVKISVDATAAANVTNLPTAVTYGNTAMWEFILTAAELSCKTAVVTIADSATKAIEDQSFIVETYGHASAMYAADLSLANLPANVTQLLGTAWLTPGTAGTPDVNVKLINAVSTSSVTTVNANQGTTQPINFTGTGASALAKSDMVDIAGAAVSTASAQIGVNAVQFGAAPVTATTSVTIPAASTLATTTGAVGSVTGAVGSVTGNVGGNVTGSVGSVVGAVGSVTGAVGSVTAGVTVTTNNDKTGYGLSAATLTSINGEVVDALNVDTYAEPGQETPGATISLAKKIGYLYKAFLNKVTQTSTTLSVYNNAGTVVDQKATVSDDGTTFTRSTIATGP